MDSPSLKPKKELASIVRVLSWEIIKLPPSTPATNPSPVLQLVVIYDIGAP